MTSGLLQGIGTVIALLAFIAVCVWAYSPKRKKEFDDAAQLPFKDEISPLQNGQGKDMTDNGDNKK